MAKSMNELAYKSPLIFMSDVFMSKNQQASLVKPIAAVDTPKIMLIFTVNPLCVSKLNKLVFNQYLMFRFITCNI